MTEFQQDLRHRCRNPRCRSKLPAPVSNPREAFCARGCHSSFYLHRCLVCEGPLERKNETQKVCRKSKCRSTFRRGFDGGRYRPSSSARDGEKTLDSIDSKPPPKADRPWFIVAGPPLTPSQLHCATVPDGPNLGPDGLPTWEGGSFQRIEAQNSRLLERHIASEQTEPPAGVPYNSCAACSREDDLVDHKVTRDGWITFCRSCRTKYLLGRQVERLERQAQYAELMAQIPDDLSIPDFLLRPPSMSANVSDIEQSLDRLAA
jgi:hypothetical protein